jgi:glutamate dehydrogenase
LDPKIISQTGLVVPYGIFFVCGIDFHGFHIRFRDVARGGIRLIKSSGPEAYNRNLETLFAENYNLANTQNRKNKDLPEFGSKGTVLLNNAEAQPLLAFQKYVSGLLDLLIRDPTLTDHYGKEEILFLGPDEGTADYMAWAATYAGKRGYTFWKAFTTGKPRSLGGIPHDLYGMTTRGVHRFVVGCLEKRGLDESLVTKLQTGGPDGDLGSNEILLSKDKTIGIVDGSGVIYDPIGINREELHRLVDTRSTVNNFNKSLLSKEGFKVLVGDRDILLPNGEQVQSGLQFRNNFHLNPISSADLFVPCGGRPESVSLTNVHKLLNKDGSPRFKIVVEGANLFFTNDARMFLEDAGVVVFKDASANKGGVLSSSLEVLASLAMNDAEHKKHMQVTDPNNIPQFYQDYVIDIQQRIEENAALEFELIWKEHDRTKIHRTILTDKISDKINTLNDLIQESNLHLNPVLRERVFHKAIPKTLIELLSIDTIIQRIPETYSKAVFGSYLASRFVYQHGLDSSDLSFYQYMQKWLQ